MLILYFFQEIFWQKISSTLYATDEFSSIINYTWHVIELLIPRPDSNNSLLYNTGWHKMTQLHCKRELAGLNSIMLSSIYLSLPGWSGFNLSMCKKQVGYHAAHVYSDWYVYSHSPIYKTHKPTSVSSMQFFHAVWTVFITTPKLQGITNCMRLQLYTVQKFFYVFY